MDKVLHVSRIECALVCVLDDLDAGNRERILHLTRMFLLSPAFTVAGFARFYSGYFFKTY